MSHVHDLQTARISTNFIHRIDTLTQLGKTLVVIRLDIGSRTIGSFDDEADAKNFCERFRASVGRALHADARHEPIHNPQLRRPRHEHQDSSG